MPPGVSVGAGHTGLFGTTLKDLLNARAARGAELADPQSIGDTPPSGADGGPADTCAMPGRCRPRRGRDAPCVPCPSPSTVWWRRSRSSRAIPATSERRHPVVSMKRISARSRVAGEVIAARGEHGAQLVVGEHRGEQLGRRRGRSMSAIGSSSQRRSRAAHLRNASRPPQRVTAVEALVRSRTSTRYERTWFSLISSTVVGPPRARWVCESSLRNRGAVHLAGCLGAFELAQNEVPLVESVDELDAGGGR